MGFGFKAGVFLCSALAFLATHLEANTLLESETAAVSAGPTNPSSKVLGYIDFRPTWRTESGAYTTENTASLGYQFSPKFQVEYFQYVTTNLFNPKEALSGASPTVWDGYTRVRVNRILESNDKKTYFSYENRTYYPMSDMTHETGGLLVMRNYLKLISEVSPVLTLSAAELPIVQVFQRPGSIFRGAPLANPVYENRIYLEADFNFTRRLSLSLPVLFHQTKYANFAPDAHNSGAWGFYGWIYPELDYLLTANSMIGVAYYSGNLIKDDFSGLTLASGFGGGSLQFLVSAYL